MEWEPKAYPLEELNAREKSFEATPNCAICGDGDPYIKYKYCQRWWYFSSRFIHPAFKSVPTLSRMKSVPMSYNTWLSTLSPPHPHFILSYPIPIVWQSPSAILKKQQEQCVYWVGEIKYCTIESYSTYTAQGAGENCTHAHTIFDYKLEMAKGFLRSSSFLFVCASRFSSSNRRFNFISYMFPFFSHTRMWRKTRRGIRGI